MRQVSKVSLDISRVENFNRVRDDSLRLSTIRRALSFSLGLEKLFDIARRVPFLAMTIIEKNNLDSPWLFRTQPLQTGATPSIREVSLELAPPPTPVLNQPAMQQKQVKQPLHFPTPPPVHEQQRLEQMSNLRARPPLGPMPVDPKKVAKSSTAPNLPTSNSLSEMFRVI